MKEQGTDHVYATRQCLAWRGGCSVSVVCPLFTLGSDPSWVLAPGESVPNLVASAFPNRKDIMVKFLLWLLLFVLCWPLALLALLLWPLVWLLTLPFRLVGIAVEGVFDLLRGILLLPGRLLRGRP